MKNKCKKKIILLLLASASAGQFGLPVPVSLAQEQFSAAELLPYFRIDFGQAHFFPVKGLPNAVGNNNGEVVKRKPLIDAYFLNLYYEIASKVSIFNPYIGAGVGLARSKG